MGARKFTVTAVLFSATAILVTVSGAGASNHPSYQLGNAQSCKANYVKKTARKSETVRLKAHSKWKVVHKVVRYVECVYVIPATTTTASPVTTTTASPVTTTTASPVTTTTASPVTTTTESQIYDQATTIFYDGFLSYNQEIGGLYYATEDADLTITGYSLSPAAGTVSFYDANGVPICSNPVPNSIFETVASCEGVGLAAAPPTPIHAVYSGTQVGYDDGYGSSYAGSSARGSPDP